MEFGYENPEDIKKIVVDPVSHEIHLFLPIFPLGKKAKPPDDFAIYNDYQNAYKQVQRAIGKADVTLMKTLDNKFAHPRNDALSVIENYKMQSNYSIGKLEYVFPKPDSNNRMWGSYNITDPVAKKVVMKYKDSFEKGIIPLFTSSQIAREPTDNPNAVKNFDLMHTTLTDGPAFGKELSMVGGVCQGDMQSCMLKYNAASDRVTDVGMTIHGDVIDLKFEECPFCVETELTNIFENNLKNSDYILNSASKASMPNNEEQKGGVVKPDEDQSGTSRAPIDVEALSENVAKKVAELTKANEVGSVEEAKGKTKDNEVNDKKDVVVDIENHPKFKAMEELVKGLVDQVKSVAGTIKEKDEKLSVLESKASETEIGDLLAAFEFNFYDPETGKADPARWEAAFKFAKEKKMTPTELRTYLETLSPYGSKPRKMEALVTNKASLNRGVPKYNSAFEGKEPGEGDQDGEEEEGGEKKLHSAGRREIPKYMNLLSTVVRDNNLE
jgi:dihydroneopterin aldolase